MARLTRASGVRPTLVNHFLEDSARVTPHKTALICDEQRISYAQLEQMANRLAHGLRDFGVKPGDRVLLYLPNCVELGIGIFGTLKASGIFVVVNSSTKREKLAYLANDCRAAMLITSGSQLAAAREVMEQTPSLKGLILTALTKEDDDSNHRIRCFDELQASYPDSAPAVMRSESDLACLIYTSGSTGEPKGVMSSHSNVVFAASSIISYLENCPEDIVINTLPLSFDYGLYQMLMTFKFGGTLILERSFAFPAQVLKRIEQERVTGFPGVPTIFSMLLRMDLSRFDLSSLRYITNTAAALPSSHIQQIRQLFPSARLFSMYGLTETKRTLYLPPEQLETRPGSVGIAIPGTHVWIEDENGNQLGANQIGELVIQGKHVMQGYWERPEETARRFRSGPDGERICYSGDLFRMDDEGYMYFVGRKDDIIKSRGEKVAPKEVENVLYSLAGVSEAAVIGVPDPILGEAIKAIIVDERGTLSKERVLRHCRANLEDFMVPQIIEFRETLPKTSSGKIKKTGLS